MNKEGNLNQDKKLDLTKNNKTKNKIPSLEDFTVSLQAVLDSEENVSECASKLFSKIFSGELDSIEDIQKKLSLLSNILLLYSNRDYSLASLIDSINFSKDEYIPNPHLDTFEECSKEDFFSSMKFKTPKNSNFKVTTTKITTNSTKNSDKLDDNTVTIDEFNNSRVSEEKIDEFNNLHNNIQPLTKQDPIDINNLQDITNIKILNLENTRKQTNISKSSVEKMNPQILLQTDNEQINQFNSNSRNKVIEELSTSRSSDIDINSNNISQVNNEQTNQFNSLDANYNPNEQFNNSRSSNNQVNQFTPSNNVNQAINTINNSRNSDTRYKPNNLFINSRSSNDQMDQINSLDNRNQPIDQFNNLYDADTKYRPSNQLNTDSRNQPADQFNTDSKNHPVNQFNNQYNTDTRYQPSNQFNSSRNNNNLFNSSNTRNQTVDQFDNSRNKQNNSRSSTPQIEQFNTSGVNNLKYNEINNLFSNNSNTDEVNTSSINVLGLEGLNLPFCCSNTSGTSDSANILNATYIKNGVYFLKKIRLYIRATKSCVFYEIYYSTRTQKLLFTNANTPYNYSHTYII